MDIAKAVKAIGAYSLTPTIVPHHFSGPDDGTWNITVPQGPEPKQVFAHFMLCNAQDYNVVDFMQDMKNAREHSIDGFTLNIGLEQWQITQLDLAFKAAELLGDFKVYPNFDMNFHKGATPQDGAVLKNIVLKNYNSPAHARSRGRPIVGTFLGQDKTFGERSASLGWKLHFQNALERAKSPITFIPFFPEDANTIDNVFSYVDGFLKWTSWPENYEGPVSDGEDYAYKRATERSGKVFMATVSPWFFKHFKESSWGNWIFRSEDTWARRWDQIIKLNPDLLQIVSWNDFGESHYIGPVLPHANYPTGCKAWVDGHDHTAFLKHLGYYIASYKAGHYLEPSHSTIALYHRPNFKSKAMSRDPIPPPRHAERALDAFVVHSIVEKPTSAWFISGKSKPIPFDIPAGVSMITINFKEEFVGNTEVKAPLCHIFGTQFQGNIDGPVNDFNVDSRFCEFRAAWLDLPPGTPLVMK